MPSRRQKFFTPGAVLVFFIGVVLGVTILFWLVNQSRKHIVLAPTGSAKFSTPGPSKKEGSATSLPILSPNSASIPASILGSNLGSNLNNQTPSVLLSQLTKTLMLNCAHGSETFSGVGRASDFTSLDQYLVQAPVLRGGTPATQELLLENLQLSTPNHEKIRIRFSPQNRTENQPPNNELKTEVFGVDSDGLPILMTFPDELVGLNHTETIEHLKARFSTVDFDEKTVAFRWLNGASATVSFRNNQIQELQIYFENRGSMGCAVNTEQVDCACLKSANQ